MGPIGSIYDFLRSIFQGAKFWFVVNPWERGVRVRLGRWSKLIEPGIYFRIPFADSVTLVNVRLRITSSPSLTVTTRDGKTVTMAVMVAFRISDPLAALLALVSPEYTCAAMAQASAATEVAALNSSDLGGECFRDGIHSRLKNIKLPGIEFEKVEITEMAIVKTFRLLNDTWKPMTQPDLSSSGF